MTSIADFVKTIPLSTIAQVAASTAAPQMKRRAAVVAHDSFRLVDGYIEARPTIFYGSLMASAAAGAMAVKRRSHGVEAVAAWSIVAMVSAGVAWVTRPTPATTAAQGRPPLEQVNAWLDQRAAQLDQSEPGWQDRALVRLLG